MKEPQLPGKIKAVCLKCQTLKPVVARSCLCLKCHVASKRK